MSNVDAGSAIEGFVLQAYGRMFENKIDRHHPLVTWADASASGRDENFEDTKAKVLTTLAGLQHTLHYDKSANNVKVLNDLGDFEAQLRESQSLTEVGNVIREANVLLDRAVKRENI